VEVFVEGQTPDDHLREDVQAELPDYMVPRRFHFKDRLPRNPNGKLDRAAISKLLDGG
jgi:acyl-coenzyme A synthetase/AMP-(fatty) acid ligase